MKIKKIVLTMLVLSVVVLGLSSSSFAANISRDMGFHHYVNHWNGNFKTFNLAEKQSNIIVAVKENNEKIREIKVELKSTVSELEDLYTEKKEMAENNTMNSNIDQRISSLESIVNNYREQLSYLESKQDDFAGSVSAMRVYKKLGTRVKGLAYHTGSFYKIRY